MLSHCRFWVTLLSSVVLGVIVAVGTAVSSGAEVSSVTGGWASTHALSSRLVIPGVQLLDGGQQESDELLTDRTSPVAVAARWRSRTQYEGLGPAAVARLVAQTEPGLVARSSSGLGRLPLGARVARYLGSRSARVVFAGGQRAVVQSLTPMAVASRDGLAPVDLRVRRAVGGFAAVRPAVPVRIPLSLADGIGVGSIGLSLTPVGPSGMALRGSGRVDGGAVLYPNTEADADTAVKPISMGLETYTTLRSVDSPQRLLYRVGVPRGATIVADRLGNVSVLAAGRVIAVIPAATAVDGAGTPVPVVTRLSDRTIELSVAHHHGDYRYPIVVDPTMIDPHIEPRSSTDWRFESEPECLKGSMCAYDEPPGFWELVARWYRASEWGALLYPTQGESRIYEMSMETASALDSGV